MENKQKILTLSELSEILKEFNGYYLGLTSFRYGVKEPGFDETLKCKILINSHRGHFERFTANIIYDRIDDLFRTIREARYVFLCVNESCGILTSVVARPIEDILDISVEEKSYCKKYRVYVKDSKSDIPYTLMSNSAPGNYLKRDFEAAGRYDLLLKMS